MQAALRQRRRRPDRPPFEPVDRQAGHLTGRLPIVSRRLLQGIPGQHRFRHAERLRLSRSGFSLRPETRGSRSPDGGSRVICLGLMDYYGKGSAHEYSEAIYQDYLEKTTNILAWLARSQVHRPAAHWRLVVRPPHQRGRDQSDCRRGVEVREGAGHRRAGSSVEQLIAQLGKQTCHCHPLSQHLLALLLNNRSSRFRTTKRSRR